MSLYPDPSKIEPYSTTLDQSGFMKGCRASDQLDSRATETAILTNIFRSKKALLVFREVELRIVRVMRVSA